MSKRTWVLVASLPALVALVLVATWLQQRVGLRLSYPYDIEWMEGGMLVHALRLRQGLPLYAEPSADWVPYIYPPLYPWLLSKLGDPSYLTARTVSLVCTGLAALAAVVGVWRERVNPLLALGAGALYLSTWDASGYFFDLVRNDALSIALAAWSLVLVRQARDWGLPAVIGGGVLLAVGYLAKHNYAAFGLPMALWLFWLDRRDCKAEAVKSPWWRAHRRTLAFVASSAGTALLLTGVLQVASDGFFLTYLVGVPGTHPLKAERAWPLSEIELLTSYTLVNVVAWVAGLAFLIRNRGTGPREGVWFWLPVAALSGGLCILMRAHHGGFINVLMPGHWALAVAGVATLGALTRDRPVLAGLASLLILGQAAEGRFGYPWKKDLDCAWTSEDPLDRCFADDWDRGKVIPTDQDIAAGDAVIEALRDFDGSVFAPHFPWYPYLAGKEPSLPLIALWDIDHKHGPLYQDPNVVAVGIREGHWDAVMVPGKGLKYGMKEHYERYQRELTQGRAMRTRTGWTVQPKELWVLKED